MKKTSLVAGLMLLSPFCHAKDIVLVENGTPKAAIQAYAADLQDEFEGTKRPPDVVADILPAALDDLVLHLEKMSGAKLPVSAVKSAAEAKAPAIVLGKLAVEMGAVPPENEEGYRLLTKDGRVLIGANTHRGIAHGIYGFLESQGCDWVMPGEIGIIAPEKKTLAIANLDQSSFPAFSHRRVWLSGGPKTVSKEDRVRFEEWCRRQRLGFPESQRNQGSGHAWSKYISSNKEAFAADPTMLALVRQPDGSLLRKGPQIEPANPKVADLIAQNIRDEFAENGWPKDKPMRFPIGPSDGDGYSISPEALALGVGRMDPVNGSEDVTDQVSYLSNEVLKRLGDEYPNVSLTYLSYSFHHMFPAVHKPHPRTNVIFAPISFSRFHATGDPISKTRTYYANVLKDWQEYLQKNDTQGTFGFYEYNWNLSDGMLPFTRIRMFGEDIPMYHKMGFDWGVIECFKAWSINAPHDYIAAKLLWDPMQDWRELLKEYCQLAYGAAAPMLERYYLGLADRQREAGLEAGSWHAVALIFDDAWVAQAKKEFAEALKQNLTPEQKTRVEYAAHPLGALELYLAWFDALNAFDFPKAKAAYDDMVAHWQAGLDRNRDLVAGAVPVYLKGLLGMTTEDALKYSSDPYRLLVRLEEAPRTILDPTNSGEQMNFQGPEIRDRDWIRTHTYTSNWDAQGLGFYRNGSVWYRFHFDLPKEGLKEGLGLFLGGYDDCADVWLNGKYIGTSGPARKFCKPVAFDITDAARPGAQNVLAIRIRRLLNLNELFTGGLFRPSYIFTGPRLQTAETAQPGKERILPGGSVE